VLICRLHHAAATCTGRIDDKGSVMRNNTRLTTPLVRRDGVLQSASWDEALAAAAAGLRDVRDADGGEAIGMFSCSKATNETNFMAQKFARVVLGSNNIDSCNRT
jgi:predicted molibdopterin-dependent oxidoreductase YjgC